MGGNAVDLPNSRQRFNGFVKTALYTPDLIMDGRWTVNADGDHQTGNGQGLQPVAYIQDPLGLESVGREVDKDQAWVAPQEHTDDIHEIGPQSGFTTREIDPGPVRILFRKSGDFVQRQFICRFLLPGKTMPAARIAPRCDRIGQFVGAVERIEIRSPHLGAQSQPASQHAGNIAERFAGCTAKSTGRFKGHEIMAGRGTEGRGTERDAT